MEASFNLLNNCFSLEFEGLPVDTGLREKK